MKKKNRTGKGVANVLVISHTTSKRYYPRGKHLPQKIFRLLQYVQLLHLLQTLFQNLPSILQI